MSSVDAIEIAWKHCEPTPLQPLLYHFACYGPPRLLTQRPPDHGTDSIELFRLYDRNPQGVRPLPSILLRPRPGRLTESPVPNQRITITTGGEFSRMPLVVIIEVASREI